MFGLPLPLLKMAGIGLGAILIAGGIYFAGFKHASARWEAATARLQVEAATLLSTETARVHEAENRANALARTIEENHALETAQNAARGADFDRRLTIRVRDAERRARGNCPGPSQAADPPPPADPAGSGDPGLGGIDPERIRAIRDAGLELQAYAKACHKWAAEVGQK